MELAFLTLLLKDGAQSIGGGIAINNEGVLKTWLSENGGGADCVDEGIECCLVLIFPVEFAAFSAVSDKRVKWSSQHAEVADVHSIEIEEAKESA